MKNLNEQYLERQKRSDVKAGNPADMRSMLIIMLTFFLSFCYESVFAEVASGISGTCYWRIDDDGLLTIGPQDGISGIINTKSRPEYEWHDYKDYITKVYIEKGVSSTNCDYLFNDLSNVKSMNLSNFDASNVTSMYSMFRNCSGLTSLDLSNFNTSKVTDMSTMFDGCSGLTSLDLSNFNTSEVTDMSMMFHGCSGLTSLDLSNFNTSNVLQSGAMFYNCTSLTSLHLSEFDTSSMNLMGYVGFTNFAIAAPNGKTFSSEKEFLKENYANGGGVYSVARRLTKKSLPLSMKWGTLCYPAAVTLSGDIKAYRATDVTKKGVIVLEEIENAIPAFTPVILFSEEGNSLSLPSAKASSFAGPIYEEGNLLVGCNGVFELNKSSQYVMQNQNGEVAFYYVDPSHPMNTTDWRAFLNYNGGTSNARLRLNLSFLGDEATGIAEAEASPAKYDILNMNGVKVTSMQKGQMYIVNGQKLYVK